MILNKRKNKNDQEIVSWIKGYSGGGVKCHFKQFDKNETYVSFDYDFGWYTSPNPENWPSDGTFYGFRVPKKIQNFPVKSKNLLY